MVTSHTFLKFVLGHVLAGAVVIVGTLLVTFICYMIGLSMAPHGIDSPVVVIPEFLILMFMTGSFAVMASTGCFLISILLTWLRLKRHFPAWLPVIVAPFLIFVVGFLIFGRTKDVSSAAFVTGLASLYFGVYWIFLTSSPGMLDLLRRSFSRHAH